MADHLDAQLAAQAARRPRELELDLLLSHELAAGSPAGRLVWERVGLQAPEDVAIALQVPRAGDGRTTDVVAEGGGSRLLCEDKLADGVEQVGQLQGLAAERDLTRCEAVVIAPRRYLERRTGKLSELKLPGVAVEDLADALERSAPLDSEMRRSYEYRIRALREVCVSRLPSLSEPGTAFRSAYNERLDEDSGGAVALQAGTLTQGGGFAEFQTGSPLPRAIRSATHKLSFGLLDVTPPTGWTLEALTTFLGSLRPGEAVPDGWTPAIPKMARPTKATGRPSPVLRHAAPVELADLSTLTPGEAATAGQACAEGVASTLLAFAAWLQLDGPRLLLTTPNDALVRLLQSASALAADLGRIGDSEAIAGLLKRHANRSDR